MAYFQPYTVFGSAPYVHNGYSLGRPEPASSDWVVDHAKDKPAPALVIHPFLNHLDSWTPISEGTVSAAMPGGNGC